MWINYLADKIIIESNKLKELIKIDNNENGTNYNIDYVLKLLGKNISFDFQNINTIIIEGNFFTLSKLLEQEGSNIYIISLDDYSINKWIIEKYKEYCDEYLITNNCNITINEQFNTDNKPVILIGSKSFIEENESRVNCFKKIELGE